MPPGSKVLYLGGASGTTVSHVSDVVGVVRRLMDMLFHCVCVCVCVILRTV